MVDIALGALLPLAMWFVVPVVAVEFFARAVRDRAALWRQRLVALGAGTVFSALWCGYVFFIDNRSDFAHWQVVGACLTVVIATATLVTWSLSRGLPWQIAATVPAVYLSLGICAVFAVIGAATDPTGQWGMGLYLLTICSLAGSLLVGAATVAGGALRA